MNSLSRAFDAAQWLVVAAMFAAGLLVWPSSPPVVPIHWNLAGQPDGYAGKLEGLFLAPTIALAIVIALRVLPRVDPMRQRYAEFAGAYALFGLIVVAVLAAVQAIVVLWVRGVQVNVGLVIGPLVGTLLIVTGLIIGEVRQNWFFGIRTPWTLSSERAWTETHRRGRWVFIVMGISIALAGILQTPWILSIATVICVGGILGLIVYSYLIWRADPARQSS